MLSDRPEDLEQAVAVFANIPWSELSDQDHDITREYTKSYRRWSNPDRECNLHLTVQDFEKSEFVSVSMALKRYKPGPIYPGSKLLASPVHVGSRLMARPDLCEKIEEILARTHFRCEKNRMMWIPRTTINCHECTHVMACATKGWEVNLS